MTTVAAIRNCNHMTCKQCGDTLIAPEWSEYVTKQHIRHLWHCTDCGYQFETSVYLPPDLELTINGGIASEEDFRALLVA